MHVLFKLARKQFVHVNWLLIAMTTDVATSLAKTFVVTQVAQKNFPVQNTLLQTFDATILLPPPLPEVESVLLWATCLATPQQFFSCCLVLNTIPATYGAPSFSIT